MAETVFLTGGTGLLGRYLIPILRARGYRLRVLLRPTSDRTGLEGSGGEFVPGDLREPAGFRAALAGARSLIHLAAIVAGSRKELLETNWRGTAALIRAAQAAGVERIVHLSSLGAKPEPRFPYAYSAWLAEQEVLNSGLQYIIFRPAILVGPGDPFTSTLWRMARSWPVMLLPKSRTRFQPLWVGDMADCIRRALEGQRPWGKTIALGGPESFTLEEIARLVMSELGINKPIIRLPRRLLRSLVKALRGLGLDLPYAPGQFIGADNVAGPGAVEAACGFEPRALREVLRLQREAGV